MTLEIIIFYKLIFKKYYIQLFYSNDLATFCSSLFIKWNLRIFVIFPLTFGRVFIVRAANCKIIKQDS